MNRIIYVRDHDLNHDYWSYRELNNNKLKLEWGSFFSIRYVNVIKYKNAADKRRNIRRFIRSKKREKFYRIDEKTFVKKKNMVRMSINKFIIMELKYGYMQKFHFTKRNKKNKYFFSTITIKDLDGKIKRFVYRNKKIVRVFLCDKKEYNRCKDRYMNSYEFEWIRDNILDHNKKIILRILRSIIPKENNCRVQKFGALGVRQLFKAKNQIHQTINYKHNNINVSMNKLVKFGANGHRKLNVK